jgi:hypothetical protein
VIIHSRFVAFNTRTDSVSLTEEHVRAHLSSIASPDDDENLYAREVRITYQVEENGIRVHGELDREPDAPYLRDDFDPEQDVTDNPLSVPSIAEEGQ